MTTNNAHSNFKRHKSIDSRKFYIGSNQDYEKLVTHQTMNETSDNSETALDQTNLVSVAPFSVTSFEENHMKMSQSTKLFSQLRKGSKGQISDLTE